MSRAHGKHGPREAAQPLPGTPEGDYSGTAAPPVKGGTNHIANEPVRQQKVPVPAEAAGVSRDHGSRGVRPGAPP